MLPKVDFNYLALDSLDNGPALFLDRRADLIVLVSQFVVVADLLLKPDRLHLKLIRKALAIVQHLKPLFNELPEDLKFEHLLEE